MWRSLVAHLTGGQGVAGSNPVIPTKQSKSLGVILAGSPVSSCNQLPQVSVHDRNKQVMPKTWRVPSVFRNSVFCTRPCHCSMALGTPSLSKMRCPSSCC